MSSSHEAIYRIEVREQISPLWLTWFDGWKIESGQAGTTLLAKRAVDQAALHGTLNRVRDLGLTLVLVRRAGTREGHTGNS